MEYFSISHERCVARHYFSPKIFVCVEEGCEGRGVICHYCIADPVAVVNAHFTRSSRFSHVNHNILPVEEYISRFRRLYFNGDDYEDDVRSTAATTTPSWTMRLHDKYSEELRKVKETITSMNESLNCSIAVTAKTVDRWFARLEKWEEDISEEKFLLHHHLLLHPQSESPLASINTEDLNRFIETSFKFLRKANSSVLPSSSSSSIDFFEVTAA